MDKPWLANYEPAVPPTLSYRPIPVFQLLADTVARFPDRPAVRLVLSYAGAQAVGGQLSYRELAEEVERFAAALRSFGVKRATASRSCCLTSSSSRWPISER